MEIVKKRLKKELKEMYEHVRKRNDAIRTNYKQNLLFGISKEIDNFKEPNKKTYYHTPNINKWLMRYQKSVNPDYLYQPKDKIRCIELRRIFEKFDADGSNTLEVEEFFDMFQENYLDEHFKEFNSEYKEFINQTHNK